MFYSTAAEHRKKFRIFLSSSFNWSFKRDFLVLLWISAFNLVFLSMVFVKNGWFRACLTSRRSSSSFYSSCSINEVRWCISSGMLGGMLIWPRVMLFTSVLMFFPVNGNSPKSIKYRMTPIDHKSLLNMLASLLRSTCAIIRSGDIKYRLDDLLCPNFLWSNPDDIKKLVSRTKSSMTLPPLERSLLTDSGAPPWDITLSLSELTWLPSSSSSTTKAFESVTMMLSG